MPTLLSGKIRGIDLGQGLTVICEVKALNWQGIDDKQKAVLYNFRINIIFRIAIILLLVAGIAVSFVQGYVLTAVFVGAILAFGVSNLVYYVNQTNRDLPNNHLQYAVTWYGLALALCGVFGYRLWSLRKRTP